MPNTNLSDLDREALRAAYEPLGEPDIPSGKYWSWDAFGAKLKQKMIDERFSVRELAKKLDLSPSTISRVCNSKPCTVEAYRCIVAWLSPRPSYQLNGTETYQVRDFGDGWIEFGTDGDAAYEEAQRMGSLVRMTVSALPRASGVPEAEAVAWRLDWIGDGGWQFTDSEVSAEYARKKGKRVEPLFAAPPPVAAPSGEADKLRHALQKIALLRLDENVDDPLADACDIADKALKKNPAASSVSVKAKAYLHILHMELEQTDERLTFSDENPFGIRGKDYDKSYEVTAYPLYLAPLSPIASEPKDAGSGEGQELTREEQIKVIGQCCVFSDWETFGEEQTIDKLHAYGYRITRTAPTGAKPGERCRCGRAATTKYDGDMLCAACAREDAHRDLDEQEMP